MRPSREGSGLLYVNPAGIAKEVSGREIKDSLAEKDKGPQLRGWGDVSGAWHPSLEEARGKSLTLLMLRRYQIRVAARQEVER